MSSDPLVLEIDGEVARLTLNRPEKRNALTRAMWAALPERVAAFERSGAKVLVVAGAGETFAAGADIGEFETVYATRESTAEYFARVADGMGALARCPKPTLAEVRGACVGGGLGLALCCDLRIAAADARFAITPARLGLTYGLADTKRLTEVVGPSVAKDMLFTGRRLEAVEALRVGLVNAVVDPEALDAAVAEKAREIADASGWSARTAKAIVARILDGAVADDAETAAWLLDAVEGEDFREGRAAFLEKRTPRFA
jgi:enoyl-CoA hydratase/carnithine racemase